MKFTVSVSALRDALAPCVRIITNKQFIPILGNVLIDASEDLFVRLTCSNLDQIVTSKCAAFVEVHGKITVGANVLAKILGNLPDEAECMFAMDENRNVIVKCGRSKVLLRTLPAAEFPHIKGEYGEPIKLDGEALTTALKASFYAASEELTRYYLIGIHLKSVGDQLDFVATDGARLALYALPLSAAFEPVILPSNAIKQFISLAGKGECELSVSQTLVRLMVGNVLVTTKVVEGTYPNYLSLINAPLTEYASMDREALINAINIALTTLDQYGTLQIALSEGLCVVSAVSADAGKTETTIDADVSKEITVSFKGEYILDALSSFIGKMIQIHFTEDQNAAHFLDSADATRHAIVMRRNR